MNVALLQVNPLNGDLDGNARRLEEAVRRAADLGADLCLAPLGALSGGAAAELAALPPFAALCAARLHALRLARPLILGCPHEEPSASRPGNAALFIRGNAASADSDNVALSEDGTALRVLCQARRGKGSPGTGWGVWAQGDEVLGLLLGQDATPGEDAFSEAVRQGFAAAGVTLVVHLDAMPFAGDRDAALRAASALARRLRLPVVRVNPAGGDGSRIYSGDSLAVDAQGRLRASAAVWNEDLLLVDSAALRGDGPLCQLAGHGQDATRARLADVYDALVCGLRDAVRKNGFRQVLLGLSGGMDSALVAALAVDALGADRVLGVLLPSPWTSRESEDDALELAANLGIATQTLPIGPLMDGVDTALAPLFAGHPRGLAEENIQSRLRGLLLMAISNKFGTLLLSTGNKSEAAVGYCTLYGDTAGSLAPLADVYKTEVYALARLSNERAGGRIPARVFSKAPTAELRPGQKDEDSLPPYAVLDELLRELIEGGRLPRPDEADPLRARVADLLWRAAFKRAQLPPALFVSPRPLARYKLPVPNTPLFGTLGGVVTEPPAPGPGKNDVFSEGRRQRQL